MLRNLICLLVLLLLFAGCGLREREKALEKQSAQLAQKEQELLLKEKTLQLKEEELTRLQLTLDSTKADSAQERNPAIPGRWSARMTCTETSCSGSAVGDVRNEIWQFGYLNNNLVVKAISGNNLARVYTGTIKGNLIELRDDVDSTAGTPATHIIVRLNLTNPSTMEGLREIERVGDCRIVYSVLLNRQ